MVIMISASLRRQLRAGVRNMSRASCMESVEAPCAFLPRSHVDPGRADDADGVEAGMLEEALIFGGEDGVPQNRRNVVVVHDALFLAVAVVEIGDELRFELVERPLRVVAQRNDAA